MPPNGTWAGRGVLEKSEESGPGNRLRTGTVRGPAQSGARTVPVRSGWETGGPSENSRAWRTTEPLRTGTVRGPLRLRLRHAGDSVSCPAPPGAACSARVSEEEVCIAPERISALASRVMLPNFIGIGAPKAGTTWLARCLGEHPQVCMAAVKETEFWKLADA